MSRFDAFLESRHQTGKWALGLCQRAERKSCFIHRPQANFVPEQIFNFSSKYLMLPVGLGRCNSGITMTNVIKRLARAIFRDYSLYRIYAHRRSDKAPAPDAQLQFQYVEQNAIVNSDDEMIVQQAWYHGDHAHAYACMKGFRIVGVCFFWYGERYATRNFWPLSPGEAKLVQIVVLPEMRGQGIASNLIQFAAQDMYRQGFNSLYARVWWSNTPSIRAFEYAGWKRVADVVEACLVFRKEPVRLRLTRICRPKDQAPSAR